ncbi:MAG TPA: DUF2071 domain-containing protein [Gemmataceae bacterium]|jgi:hypothetical protein|nr:DUF2071 domain-containing protein [Gemmataceae bacterium]
MSVSFLTAQWSNLFLATYAVPKELLTPRLPPGLELDLRDGQAFVSLVAFDFIDTRVLGIPWPGYRNFPELNLRFYVRHGNDRGVVFIREYVGKRLVAWIARGLYNEPYRVAPMTSVVTEDSETNTVEHRLTVAGRTNILRVTGSKPSYCPEPASVEHFFKEHHWGFNMDRGGRTVRYRVDHPKWEIFPIKGFHIDLDWETVYGPEWKEMQDSKPMSTILAQGSQVAVYPTGRLVGSS